MRGLALREVTKRFGETVALDAATCLVREGTVHALLGENGAGKTTLMRIAFGLVAADHGEIELHGTPLRLSSSAAAIAAGIGMVHQHFSLIPAMTVAENVALGGHGRFDPAVAVERTLAVARATGLELDPMARVDTLPVSAQQRLEIVKALARDARILILDEPTAVLSPEEADELHAWLRRFAAGGGTVVLITHRLDEALAFADEVTVLRRGRTVLTAETSAVDSFEVVRALTGDEGLARDLAALSVAKRRARPSPGQMSDPVLRLDAVGHVDGSGVTRLAEVTLAVHAGEILGVLAVEGSGERELLRILAGRLAPTSGRVHRPATVGFVPADRMHDALIPSLTLTENFALAGAGARRGLVPWTALHERTKMAIDRFDIRSTGPSQVVGELSGGNQQRFVVARERAIAPGALIAENPGRGLDIRAAAQVHRELEAAGEEGAAVVFHSADLEEVLAIATRVIVCFRGRVTEVPFPADPLDRSVYTRAMMGVRA